MIDEYPILAVAAAFARGRTVMHGLAELRVKESDRLAASSPGFAPAASMHVTTATALSSKVSADRHLAERASGHHDHRIAMSFLVMGLAAQRPVAVDSGDMIATSFPDFVPLMQSLGARIA
jgi:3-phosphoshikimate 1-carboxyvinyltransferase